MSGTTITAQKLYVFKGCWVVFFIFIKIFIEILQANSGDPDQTSRSAASGLGLHCLPMSHKRTLDLYGLFK